VIGVGVLLDTFQVRTITVLAMATLVGTGELVAVTTEPAAVCVTGTDRAAE
jgi:uncharacterized membrane protein YdfJ with MMPL/SSD domain